MYVCNFIDSPSGCKFLLKASLHLHILHFYRCHLYQPLATGSGSILGAGSSRALPGIGIGRRAIVVVSTRYIWSYVNSKAGVLPLRLRSQEFNPRHALSLLVITPRHYWPFPFWIYSLRWIPNH